MKLEAYDKDADSYICIHTSDSVEELQELGIRLWTSFCLNRKDTGEPIDWLVISFDDDTPIEYLSSDAWETYTIDGARLADIYNGSDIDALMYMHPFCKGDLKTLCEQIIVINERHDGNDGSDAYNNGMLKLLNHFGVERDPKTGDAYFNANN